VVENNILITSWFYFSYIFINLSSFKEVDSQTFPFQKLSKFCDIERIVLKPHWIPTLYKGNNLSSFMKHQTEIKPSAV